MKKGDPPAAIIGTPGRAQKRIDYVALADLIAAKLPRNVKDHDLGELHASMNRFGLVGALLLDERSGKLIAGHGRLDALVQKREAGETPPRGVDVRDGEWFIPVIRGDFFNSDAEAEAYAIADNQLTIAGGWLEDELTAELQRIVEESGTLDGIGFDLEDLDARLRAAAFGSEEEEGEGVDPAEEWQGMPEFTHEDKTAYRSIIVHFKDEEAVQAFAVLLGQNVTPKTRYLWYPKMEIETYADKQYAAES